MLRSSHWLKLVLVLFALSLPCECAAHISRHLIYNESANTAAVPLVSSLPSAEIKLNLVGAGLTTISSDANDPPAKFPNIDRLGSGYDMVVGNPHSTTQGGSTFDPGFRQSVFQFVYSGRTTGDGRWQLPDGVDATQELVCSYDSLSTDIFGETSYYNSLAVSASVSAGTNMLGSFSASADYIRVSNETRTNHVIEVHTTAICSTYKTDLESFTPPKYTENFISAIGALVKNPGDPALQIKILSAFGTHVTVRTVMGAKAIVQSKFSESNYYSMEDQGINIHTAASYSFMSFTGSVSANASEQQRLTEIYNSKRDEEYDTFIGSKPSTDGKWTTWAQTVELDPLPITYQLQSLDTLVTPEAFPQFDPNAVNTASYALQVAISAYCNGRGISCAGPRPDSTVVTRLTSNSGSGQVLYSCPVGLPLSVGMTSRSAPGGRYSTNPAYFIHWNDFKAECWAPTDSMTCSAICTTAFSNILYIVSAKGNGVVTADCPAGYVVAGCGYLGQSSSEEAYPNSYPVSSTSCSCYNYFGVQCAASCVPAAEVKNYEIVTMYVTAGVASCPLNKSLLGCGYKASNNGYEKWWYVGPASSTECRCYDYFGATCYAICGEY